MPIVDLERVKVGVVKPAGVDDLSGEDISVKEMGMYRPESLLVFNILECLIRKRNLACL